MKRQTGGAVAFPSVGRPRSRCGSTSSVSSTDIPSPVSLFRAQAGAGPCSRTQSQSAARRPVQRHTSNSSASLFFGPSIPGPETKSPTRSTLRPNFTTHRTQAKMENRHTYSNDIHATSEATPSKSPPFNPLPNYSEEDTDIDDFFSLLPKKYKPRDSVVMFESDDDRIPNVPGVSSSFSTITAVTVLTRQYSPVRHLAGHPVTAHS